LERSGRGYEAFIEKSRDVTYAPGVGDGLGMANRAPLWSPMRAKTLALSQTGSRTECRVNAHSSSGRGGRKGDWARVFSSLQGCATPEDRLLQAVRVIGSQSANICDASKRGGLAKIPVAMDNSADMIVLTTCHHALRGRQTRLHAVARLLREECSDGPARLLPTAGEARSVPTRVHPRTFPSTGYRDPHLFSAWFEGRFLDRSLWDEPRVGGWRMKFKMV